MAVKPGFGSRLLLCGALAIGAGCDTSVKVLADWPSDGGAGGGGGDGGGSAPDGGTGLPCDVQMLLQSTCDACHGSPPSGGAPMSLVTWADLTKKSYADPNKTFAERALVRMQDPNAPMPPAPAAAATPAQIMAMQSWVDAGMPATGCDQMVTADPLDAAPTCTSGETWLFGDVGSGDMNPGQACIACHRTNREAPSLVVGGTVYPTGHEPDDCYGGPQKDNLGAATVVITGADKQEKRLTVNTSGNFYLRSRDGSIAFPYTAKVVYDGKERVMATPQSTGDCNSCHTQDGTMDAPGRITLPN